VCNETISCGAVIGTNLVFYGQVGASAPQFPHCFQVIILSSVEKSRATILHNDMKKELLKPG